MLINPAVQTLIREWKQVAETFRRYGDDARATLLTTVAGELEEVLHSESDEVLNLTQAAERSGLSADYIGRLVRSEKIPNLGRKGAPRVRVSDLPRVAPAQNKPALLFNRAELYREAARAVVANS